MSRLHLILVVLLHTIHGNYNFVAAQGATLAKVDIPIVDSTVGNEAKLSCAISSGDDDSSSSTPSGLRFCVWERVQQEPSLKNNAFIINFNEINSQPGIYSGMPGYSYEGEGFRNGECGVKIGAVKGDDFAKWQCTLITDDKVHRGYVDLVKSDPPPKPEENKTLSVASSRTAIDDSTGDAVSQPENRPRPIITSYNDARAIIQPEIIVHSTSSDGTQLIQEVKVESAGLQIKPRRGKLIVFE